MTFILNCVAQAHRITKEKGKDMNNSVKRQGEVWTREEVRTLRTLFRNTATAVVAQALDRTPKAVERKAAKLNLTKTKKYLRKIGRNV